MALKVIPGIISDVLANILRKPATIDYPKKKSPVPSGFRGRIVVNDRCISCGSCVRACPAGAITLEKTRIVVSTLRCINCGRCVEVCPVKAINFTSEYEIIASDRGESFIHNYRMAKCRVCGKEFDNLRKLEMMAEKTKQPIENFLICLECKQKKVSEGKGDARAGKGEEGPR